MTTTPRPWRERTAPVSGDILFVGPDGHAIGKVFRNGVTNAENDTIFLLKAVNTFDEARAALEQIAQGKGAFDTDQLKHCENCLEEAKATAKAVLAKFNKAGAP